MDNNTIKKTISQCLENVGIEFDNTDSNLSDSLVDSLVFISFIIELEENFGIEFDDDIFSDDNFRTLDDLCEVIKTYINSSIQSTGEESAFP